MVLIMSIAVFWGIGFKRTCGAATAKAKENPTLAKNDMEKDYKEKAVDKLRVIGDSLLEALIRRLHSGLLNGSDFEMWRPIGKPMKAANRTRNEERKFHGIHKDDANRIAKETKAPTDGTENKGGRGQEAGRRPREPRDPGGPGQPDRDNLDRNRTPDPDGEARISVNNIAQNTVSLNIRHH
ncbi:MAG: hypothetical protein LBF41_06750 [Deltaproteobacteria bacterium]|nr:hypothetical protein [Deltaproteobacteria bacterium]